MVPIDKVKEIITRYDALEKELSSGNIDPKLFAKKSKEYASLRNIILVAKEYLNFEKEKKGLDQILNEKNNDSEIIELAKKDLKEILLAKKYLETVIKNYPDTDYAKDSKYKLEFINEIKGGNVPKEFIPSVEKGFKEAMKNGPLAGFEVDSIKVTLKDGSFHPVDSDSLSFELAAKLGFKEAARLAKSVIMEPMMKLEVLTPEENMGDIVGDLNRRRGQVNNMDDRAGSKVVKAVVPLSEMFGYVTSLRTLSSGRATSTMEFSHYSQTPSNVSEEVVASIKGNQE